MILICYFVVPIPIVTVTALNQSIGSPLSLRCDITTVKGVTSSIKIVWMTDQELRMEIINTTSDKSTYTDYYNRSKVLTLKDNNTEYHCQVFLNKIPPINESLTLNLTGNGK